MTHDLPLFPLDHLPLFGQPLASALAIRDRTYNYQELNLRIGRLAGWLAATDLHSGDRVATWLGKGEIACLMPFAAVRAGFVHVPVNPLLKAPQLAHIMADSGARLLMTNAARAATLNPRQDLEDCSVIDENALLEVLDDSTAPSLPPLPTPADDNTQVTFVLTCLLLGVVAATYVFTRSRPVYLLNFHCFKPPAK